MIISKVYNKLNKEQQGDFASGLAIGLVFGLAFGLTSGLAFGLAFGLASGLTSGLVIILCHFSEALPLLYGFYPILFLIMGIIILSEVMFWLMPKEELDKKVNIFWHTAKRKGENILEVLLGLSAIAQVYILTREVQVKQYFPEILKWIGYIGAGIIILGAIIGLIYVWIKLNSLKYRR